LLFSQAIFHRVWDVGFMRGLGSTCFGRSFAHSVLLQVLTLSGADAVASHGKQKLKLMKTAGLLTEGVERG
jgi:hypothetical protein